MFNISVNIDKLTLFINRSSVGNKSKLVSFVEMEAIDYLRESYMIYASEQEFDTKESKRLMTMYINDRNMGKPILECIAECDKYANRFYGRKAEFYRAFITGMELIAYRNFRK